MIRLKYLLKEQDLKPYIQSTNWYGGITWNYPAIEKCNNPADIAAILKKAKGVVQDDEAAAEAAFIAITNRSPKAARNFYFQVNGALGNYKDAYTYVQSYMDTSIKYHKRSIDDSAKIIQTTIGAEDPKELDTTNDDIRELPPVVISMYGVQKAREIKRTVVRAFNDAIKWWITYLSLPRTQANFNLNWDGKKLAEKIFPVYINALKHAKVRIFYSPYANYGGYYAPKYPWTEEPQPLDVTQRGKYININVAQYTDYKVLKSSMVHELQHMLFDIHPLNPGDTYKTAGLQEPVPDAIQGISKKLTDSVVIQLQKLPGLKTVTMLDLVNLALDALKAMTNDPEYACRDNEQGSKLEAIRSDLNKDLLVPKDFFAAFKGPTADPNYRYILFCWVHKGYPDFQQYIMNLNMLVKNDDKEKPETIKLASLVPPQTT